MAKRILCLGIILAISLCLFGCAEEEQIFESKGTFFSLTKAYELQMITQEHLKNIDYYHSGENVEYEIQPIPIVPLSKVLKDKIIETKAYDLQNQPKPIRNVKKENITIIGYYGTYNQCVAVKMHDSYHNYRQAKRLVIIGDVVFHYSGNNSIVVWVQTQSIDKPPLV